MNMRNALSTRFQVHAKFAFNNPFVVSARHRVFVSKAGAKVQGARTQGFENTICMMVYNMLCLEVSQL